MREGDDLGDDRRTYLPWEQGIWEGEGDGQFGAKFGENYKRDHNIADNILTLGIVRASSRGRICEAAIRNKYRHICSARLEFSDKSVEDHFHRDTTFRKQMTRNGWRSERISGVDREAKGCLTPGQWRHQERNNYKGPTGTSVRPARTKPCSWASKSCPALDSASNYWSEKGEQQ